MAGAMRRMVIYLGLVEDDDPRGYSRYDSRQADHPDHDRRYGRYADDDYDAHYEGDYPPGAYAEDDPEADSPPPVREGRRSSAAPRSYATRRATGSRRWRAGSPPLALGSRSARPA